MKKNLLIVVGGIVLVLAVVLWQLLANLDSIVAGVIEDVGSDVVKTKVSVSGVSIDLKGGKAGIAGLTVANPDGYSRANLFELEDIAVDLDLGSIGEDVLVINTIRIQNPRINYEGDAKGGSNMQTLLNNIEKSSSGGSPESGGEELKMIVNNFELSGAQVKGTTKLKPDTPIDFKLSTIKMSNIGKAQGGVTADVVAEEITRKIVSAVISSAAKAGINKVIEEKSKGLLDKLKREK
jgi:hypothetical protein